MKERILALVLALTLCLSTACAAGAAEQTFSDVLADAWYAEAVAHCNAQGLMTGMPDGSFSPNIPATRAMLVIGLYRQAGSPTVTKKSTFPDVSADADYHDAVVWAAEREIISGYTDGRFGPDDQVTREQFAAILWRSAGKPVADTAEAFADQNQIADYAVAPVNWARDNEIIHGRENNIFDPRANITRGEAAVMLYQWGKVFGSSNVPVSTPTMPSGTKVLVAYFSATNTTRLLAEDTADILDAELYEIVPETPYTEADLKYYTNCRADKEQNDPSARPAISGSVADMNQYDVVFIGYPIWHGQAPRIISTFLESYDFAGKTIVPFCTSHSSGIGSSDTNLHSLTIDANWLSGKRFAAGTARETIKEWIDTLNLSKNENPGGFDFETRTVTLNSGYVMPINGLGTYSLHGDTCINAVKSALKNGVRLIDTASAYGNEVEVGQAIREAMEEYGISREEIFVITKIYPGSEMADPERSIQACIDRLDIGYVDMMLLHHPDRNDVKAYQTMETFVEAGKIRSLGLSNWYVAELESFLPQVHIKPSLVQNEIHPYYQENDVIPYIQEQGITVQGWYPLGGRGHTAELLNHETIASIAKDHDVSSAQVILRWNLQKGVVVIPGSSNPDHIKENTELYHFELTADEMSRINALDRGEKHDWY